MKTKNSSIKRWDDIDWRKAEKSVHRQQCRIFEAALQRNTCETSNLQLKLMKSFYARAIAVRQVAVLSQGRKTPGPDGISRPTKAELLSMTNTLEMNHRPSPVRRKLIPKPGKKDYRALGIPNLVDRAHQALIALVLEPQWETRLPGTMFGFRKRRGTKDAISYLQVCLRRSPRWVLDADIEKFFDNIDHDALLGMIDAPEQIALAVRRCLKAGVSLGETTYDNQIGTPQGGPLSPLLANIALSGLPDHLYRRYYETVGNKTDLPKVVLYADDMVITHSRLHIVKASMGWVNEYLVRLGLKLSPAKTRVCNTLSRPEDGGAIGFDFLGVHFQHHLIRGKDGKHRPYLLATPCRGSQKRLYLECKDLVKGCVISRKHASRRKFLSSSGMEDPVSLMIYRLNRKLRGWANYFDSVNSKETFSRMDHLIHLLMDRWARKQFKRKPINWIIKHIFSGVETGQNGEPLLKQDGTPRQRSWIFKSPFTGNDEDHKTLMKLSDVPVKRHVMVRLNKSYFDNDWIYWGNRGSSRYPGTPECINISALRRQKGKCPICRLAFSTTDTLVKLECGKGKVLVHHTCCNQGATCPS